MSGSSARKLRRGSANLLGGRAIEKQLHTLSVSEVGEQFNLEFALSYGTLPRIYSFALENNLDEVRALLGSYYTIYIQQEIQAEALTRNVPSFQRFLRVAAQSNGNIIEYLNIGRQCQVDDSTVKGYFEILEDTLMGSFHYQWDASERKKSRPKFYFFDPGVVRALQNRLYDPPTGQELGFLFETWFIRELIKIKDYEMPYLDLSYWKDRNDEVDVICSRAGKLKLGIELKSGIDDQISEVTVNKFKARFPKTKLIVASRIAERPKLAEAGVEIIPWKLALDMVRAEI